MDQPRLERPFRITLSLTERCNLKCQWCYSDCGARPESQELSTEQWRHVIDDAVSCGVIKMFIEGVSLCFARTRSIWSNTRPQVV